MLNFRERWGAALFYRTCVSFSYSSVQPCSSWRGSAALGTENSCHTQQNLIRQEMVLLPDLVGGRKRVVKQGTAIERGRGEGLKRGLGGGRERELMYCSVHAPHKPGWG